MAYNMLNDIEGSKENVLPIAKGRNPKALRSALKPCLEDEFSQIQRAFEQELRTYEGDDPLSVWIRYITWMDQSFVKGGHKGNLSKLIQQCLANLVSEDQYIDDDRFIDIWLRFAGMTKDPLVVYDNMHARNIACKAAKFYTAWAWELEQSGNFKRADEVLMEGIHRNAQPNADIKSAHTHLEARMVKAFSVRETSEPVSTKAERQALNTLRTINKKVPVVRVDHLIAHPNNENMPLSTSNFSQPSFKIHSSENDPKWMSRNSDKPSDFALYTGNSKENDRKVSKWNKVRAKCRTEPSSTPQFAVHVDENTPPPNTACKVPQSSGILSSKKQSPPIALFEKLNPMKRSMYDKAKVYSGTEEFSFEEIRAAAYWKKREQEEEEESKKRDKLMILQLQEQMKILQEKVEQMTATSHSSEPKEPDNIEKHDTPCIDEHPSMPKELSPKSLENMGDPPVPTNVLNRAGESECSMLHELYNGTLNFHSRNNSNSESMHKNFEFQNDVNCDLKILDSNQKKDQAFEFFLDATDVIIPQPAIRSIQIFSDEDNMKENFQPPSVQKAQHQKIINQENAADIDFENIPPPDYIQQHIKRDLVGILEPSKDIPFIPLEEQLKQQENDSEEEVDFDSCFARLPTDVNIPMEDFSIGLNTEQFAAVVVASTPFIKHAKESMVSQLAKSTCTSMPPPESTTVPVSIVKPCHDLAEGNFYLSAHSWKLNTINEMSNEGSSGYSKSSTSSSGNETTYRTKIGHQYSTSLSSPSSSTSRHVTRTSESEESEHYGRMLPPATRIANVQNQLWNTDVDPFDRATTNSFLNNLAVPLYHRENFHDFRNATFSIKKPLVINTMEYHFTEREPYATGSYAKVHTAQTFSDLLSDESIQINNVAIKECPEANEWEFYICSELSSRLDQGGSPSVHNCVINIHKAVAFQNCLVLISNLYTSGTLLDLANTYKQKNTSIPENIILYLTYELLLIVSKVHSCGILHGDVKPDNFLLNKIPDISVLDSMDNEISSLCLIDFGKAIDLTLYKPGVCFTSVITTKGFQCIEMQEKRPWVHQPDWFGVASCIHMLMFSDYLKVKKNVTTGLWEPVSKFKRYWKVEFWHSLFTTLLNIENCYDELDLQPYLDKIKELLYSQVYQFRLCTNKMLDFVTK